MTDFFEELAEGAIQLRDKYQLELKEEYSPLFGGEESTYTLEFYFYIPASLQINQDTYSKKQFYRDQTSLIRYKTPQLSLKDVIDLKNHNSPLHILHESMEKNGSCTPKEIKDEFRLFANIVRSRIRDEVRGITHKLVAEDFLEKTEQINHKTEILCDHLRALRKAMGEFEKEFFKKRLHKAHKIEWDYIDEFISLSAEHYLTGLLEVIREKSSPQLDLSDQDVTATIIQETDYRKEKEFGTQFSQHDPKATSQALYRASLLNKYVSEVLFLMITRNEPSRKFQQLAATLAAALAMLVYMALFTWRGLNGVIDSTALIIFSVLLYVLKDRVKEGVKNYSARLASEWYPDYTTKIKTPDGAETIGELSEYFCFLENDEIPPEINEMRSREVHSDHGNLDKLKRIENMMYIKKEVKIDPSLAFSHKRMHKVNDIFRFSINHFLIKASDAREDYHYLDPITKQLDMVQCSKVYHINIILKKKFSTKQGKRRVEFDRFRIILDKEGIKRVEKVEL